MTLLKYAPIAAKCIRKGKFQNDLLDSDRALTEVAAEDTGSRTDTVQMSGRECGGGFMSSSSQSATAISHGTFWMSGK